ncbi:MAG: hypothetical protein HKN43_15505 [Rhodothermales bacterium]|nr:hypothetical protein [Rhodothermales bacterium]
MNSTWECVPIIKSTLVPLAIVIVLLSGCGSSNHLADYEYRDHSLAVAFDYPPYPEVFTGPYFPGHPDRPIHAVIRLGTRIAKEIEASELRDRLEEASEEIDIAFEVADRVLVRSARYLRTTVTDDQAAADYLMEVRIRDYGIDAKEWNSAARFFIDAEVTLIDGFSGREIWKTRVRERENVAPAIFGPGAVRDVVTANAFSRLSVEEITIALDRLAEFSADHIVGHLRRSLQKARG